MVGEVNNRVFRVVADDLVGLDVDTVLGFELGDPCFEGAIR